MESASPVDHIARRAAPLPLCVDLDGTLIAGDMLMETIVHLLRHRPVDLLAAPLWLMRGGRAGLKKRVAERGTIDPQSLPYRAEVLGFLRAEREAGRTIVLATAADASVAHTIAGHLQLFDAVLCSDGTTNLKGSAKLAAIRAKYPGGFDYMGDAIADLPLFEAAASVYVVAPKLGVLRRARAVSTPVRVFQSSGGGPAASLRCLRPHQWSKNLLLFLPVFLAHEWHDNRRLLAITIGFIAFSLCASAVYVANDLLDVQDDRHHPRKKRRPFASGALSLSWGPVLLAGLLTIAFGVSLVFLNRSFVWILGGYFALSTSYSMYFKRKLLVDVMLLAGLYTIRLLAGGAASEVEVSPWLLAFSTFIFVSLAFAKRYAELSNVLRKSRAESAGQESAESALALRGRGYQVEDLDVILVVGPCSGYLAVMVFALYIYSSDMATKLYKHPLMLWLVCPLMLYWITRIWFIARRGNLHEDPVLFAMKDRVSWYALGTAFVLVLAASL